MRIILLVFFLQYIFFAQEKQIEITKLSAGNESGRIVIDGNTDNNWSIINSNNHFKQYEPVPLEEASKDTEFKVTYDSENIYFLVKSFQRKEELVTQLGKRDQSNENVDNISIYIDPLYDKTSGYQFSVNPSNIQYDARLYDNGSFDEDWDAIWESATRVYDTYWQAEFRIPLKAIKFQAKNEQTWGLNVGRYYKHNNERSYWEAVDPRIGFKVSNFGKLNGLTKLNRPTEVIFTPSVLATFNNSNNYDPGKNKLTAFDLRYNIDQQHSLVATYKPDFAQIEADEDVINFTEYPDDLREKRPFFLDGNELYSMNDEVYYSRRMTKPDAGLKFYGNSGHFKYGLMYVRNDAQTELSEKLLFHKENFILPVLRYVNGNMVDIAFMTGHVDSEYELSGSLYAFNARYSPNDHLQFNTLMAKTVIKKNEAYDPAEHEKNNHSIRLQMNYNYMDYSGRLRFQKKTEGFEQGMVGEWERNNATEYDYSLYKLMRFGNSSLRSIRLGLSSYGIGTYDNKVFNHNHNLTLRFRFTEKYMGNILFDSRASWRSGDFRYRDFDESTNRKTVYRDNFGLFIGEDNTHFSYDFRLRSDFSKAFAFRFFHRISEFRQAERIDYNGSIQYRPNDRLRFEFLLNYIALGSSKFVNSAIYKTFALKNQLSFTNYLNLKSYTQYNSQSEILSNNLVLSYEYMRGSFIYFAYNESGIIDDEFTSGTLLKNYDLENRTISLKWTYAFFL